MEEANINHLNSKERRDAYLKLLNEGITKETLNELPVYKYGRTIDETLTNNLSIMCPDVEYELHKQIEIENIESWLEDYRNYLNKLFETYEKRVKNEHEKIKDEHNLCKRGLEVNLDLLEDKIPLEIRRKIYEFVPTFNKGKILLNTSWENIKEGLKMKKVERLMEINRYIKTKIVTIPLFSCGQRIEVSKLKDLINRPIQRTKTEILNFLENLIKNLININVRNKVHRQIFIKVGYDILLVCGVIIMDEKKRREKIIEDRKKLKKEKRKEKRIKKD